MESAAEWVRAMVEAGHEVVEVRVAEPWAAALVGYDVAPPLPGEQDRIALVAADGVTYHATLVIG